VRRTRSRGAGAGAAVAVRRGLNGGHLEVSREEMFKFLEQFNVRTNRDLWNEFNARRADWGPYGVRKSQVPLAQVDQVAARLDAECKNPDQFGDKHEQAFLAIKALHEYPEWMNRTLFNDAKARTTRTFTELVPLYEDHRLYNLHKMLQYFPYAPQTQWLVGSLCQMASVFHGQKRAKERAQKPGQMRLFEHGVQKYRAAANVFQDLADDGIELAADLVRCFRNEPRRPHVDGEEFDLTAAGMPTATRPTERRARPTAQRARSMEKRARPMEHRARSMEKRARPIAHRARSMEKRARPFEQRAQTFEQRRDKSRRGRR
jgi:hypothetical protein